MALAIVATAKATNANSFVTLAEAETYMESRLAVTNWDLAATTDDMKNRALRMATDQLDLALDYGADVVLTKPIGPEELFDALDEALNTTLPRPPTDLFSRDKTTAHKRRKRGPS